MGYYAVANGRKTGVYSNWNDCKEKVNGYSGASFKKFSTQQEAVNFVNSNKSSGGSSGHLGSSHGSSSGYGYSSGSSYGSSSASRSASKPAPKSIAQSGGSYKSSGGVSKPAPAKSSASKLGLGASKSSNHQKIYVDGAARGNGKSGTPKLGYGVYYGPGDSRNRGVPLSSVDDVKKVTPTNQRAELHALRHSLRDVWKEVKANPNSNKTYEILTDSSYGKSCVDDWAGKWTTNGWKASNGNPVANRDLIEESHALYNKINSQGLVRLTHVPGHLGVAGNEAADRLANEGADKM